MYILEKLGHYTDEPQKKEEVQEVEEEEVNEATYQASGTVKYVEGEYDWQNKLIVEAKANKKVEIQMSASDLKAVAAGKTVRVDDIKITT